MNENTHTVRSQIKLRLPSTSASIFPKQIEARNEFTVRLTGWKIFASSKVKVHILIVCEMSALDFRPVTVILDKSGNGEVTVPNGIDVEGLWSMYVDFVAAESNEYVPEVNPASLINWSGQGLSDKETQEVHKEIMEQHKTVFGTPVGDPHDPNNKQHRVVCIFTGLLTTVSVFFPGLVTIPLKDRPVDTDHAELFNNFMQGLGLPVNINMNQWRSSKINRYPSTALFLPQVWAPDIDSAHLIATEMIENVRLVLAVNRLANGTPIVLSIEQRQPDNQSNRRIYPYQTTYEGNLAGGTIAGESTESLSIGYRSISSNPLLRLGAHLFAEALTEKSQDFKFFKHWAVLEVLSQSHSVKEPVTLLNGKKWPDNINPLDPGPRVYSMLKSILLKSNIDEKSFCHPAPDLYSLVQVLKARRNATAHYGGFDPTSESQIARQWYKDASKSLISVDEWIRVARRLSVTSLHYVTHP